MKFIQFTNVTGLEVLINSDYVTCVREEISAESKITLIYVNGVNSPMVLTNESYKNVMDKLKDGENIG